MASIWSAVAGAAQGFSAVKQREYEEKLKAQEEANAEARALRMQRAKMEMGRQERAGSVLGAPTRNTVTGQIEGFVYGPDGKSIEQRSFGSLPPEEVEMYRAQREREVQKEELGLQGLLARIEKDETAADKNRRYRPGSGSGGSLTAYQQLQLARAEEADRKKAIKEAENTALEEAGIFKDDGRWVQWDLSRPNSSKPDAVDPKTVSTIRAEARRGLLAPDEIGASQANPLPVTADSPEPAIGTWIQLPDGRVVQHR